MYKGWVSLKMLKDLLVFIKECCYLYKNHFRELIQISYIFIISVKCLPDYLPNMKLCF